MKTTLLVAIMVVFGTLGEGAMAENTCPSKAIDKNGKPLVGAALASFLKKCNTDYCNSQAIDKNGKPLVGAAKTSFMNKCVSSQ